jgi:hypothetical protein
MIPKLRGRKPNLAERRRKMAVAGKPQGERERREIEAFGSRRGPGRATSCVKYRGGRLRPAKRSVDMPVRHPRSRHRSAGTGQVRFQNCRSSDQSTRRTTARRSPHRRRAQSEVRSPTGNEPVPLTGHQMMRTQPQVLQAEVSARLRRRNSRWTARAPGPSEF